MRSLDSSCGTAVIPLPPPPLLGSRSSRTILFVFVVCLVCRIASPHFPYHFRRRRLQDFVYFYRKHTETMRGRELTFLSGRKVYIYFTSIANTPILQTTVVHGCVPYNLAEFCCVRLCVFVWICDCVFVFFTLNRSFYTRRHTFIKIKKQQL